MFIRNLGNVFKIFEDILPLMFEKTPKSGLIISVGVGQGIESAICYSISVSHPDKVIFLVTPQSEKDTMERVQKECAKKDVEIPESELILIENENDVEAVFKKAREAIKRMRKSDIPPANITVDYTYGTKSMSAGLLYATILERCGHIRYVTGKRDSKTGRVIPGTEKELTTSIRDLLAPIVIKDAISFFNLYQFAAAKRVLESFLEGMDEESAMKVYPSICRLFKLCEVYRHWDAFNHEDALKAFEEVDREAIRNIAPQIGVNKGWLGKIVNGLKGEEGLNFAEELLVDLWMNARRRMEEERYVDAVSRFYRLTEMIAQHQLEKNYGIDTRNVDIEKVPENLRNELGNYRDEKGKIKIPLFKAYELLASLGDPLGKKVMEDENTYKLFRSVISFRNNSIAAHGTQLVGKDFAEKFEKFVEELLKEAIGERKLEKMEKEAAFPKLDPQKIS